MDRAFEIARASERNEQSLVTLIIPILLLAIFMTLFSVARVCAFALIRLLSLCATSCLFSLFRVHALML